MKLLIAAPMYGGQCTAAFWRSTLNLENILCRVKLEHDWLETTNESLITRGRNTIAARFLKNESYTHLFFIDADIEFTPDDVAALWNMDADIAVGCYPRKELRASYAVWHKGKLLKLEDLEGKPFEVDYAGTGFMLIKRNVFETLRDKHPEWEYHEGHVNQCWGFFQDPIEDGIHLSEDYFFSKRAREAGFKVMMDPAVKLKHWGTHRFDGT